VRNRSGSACLLLVAVLVGFAAPVAAAIPDAAGVFHGCHAAGSGALRLVEPDATCGPDEASVSWSLAPVAVRLQGIGHGGPVPANAWTDVPDAAVRLEATTTACSATYTGFLVHHGGTTRATVQLAFRPDSGPLLPFPGEITVMVAGEPTMSGAVASVPVTVQALFSPPTGGTVVPRVLAADDSWVVGDPSVLLVAC
jgi:hypothetical protein